MKRQMISALLSKRRALQRGLACGGALLALRAWSAPEAQHGATGFELERLPTGEQEVALVDHLYPASGNPEMRRAALEQVARYFPNDGNTQFRVGVRLALALTDATSKAC